MIEAEEQGLVQELVAQAALEALADAVLRRLTRRDVMPGIFGACSDELRASCRTVNVNPANRDGGIGGATIPNEHLAAQLVGALVSAQQDLAARSSRINKL